MLQRVIFIFVFAITELTCDFLRPVFRVLLSDASLFQTPIDPQSHLFGTDAHVVAEGLLKQIGGPPVALQALGGHAEALGAAHHGRFRATQVVAI